MGTADAFRYRIIPLSLGVLAMVVVRFGAPTPASLGAKHTTEIRVAAGPRWSECSERASNKVVVGEAIQLSCGAAQPSCNSVSPRGAVK